MAMNRLNQLRLCSRGRSHNLVEWAVRPRKHLLESCNLRMSIRTIFNRNKSVAALPVNPKRPTLMKASFQLGDLFIFADFVGGLISFCCVLLTYAKSANRQIINGL